MLHIYLFHEYHTKNGAWDEIYIEVSCHTLTSQSVETYYMVYETS